MRIVYVVNAVQTANVYLLWSYDIFIFHLVFFTDIYCLADASGNNLIENKPMSVSAINS